MLRINRSGFPVNRPSGQVPTGHAREEGRPLR